MIRGFPDKAAWRSSGSRRSRLLRERRDQMEPHRVRGQDKAVFHAGAGLRLVGELIVVCHDQQTISRVQLRYLLRCDALYGSSLVIGGGEERCKAQPTVVASAEARPRRLMVSALLCPVRRR